MAGPYFANLLSQKLGYGVQANEPYYTRAAARVPNAFFRTPSYPNGRSEAAKHLLQYIPAPNLGSTTFSTGKMLRDDKGSFRLGGNRQRWGLLSAYYFFATIT